MGMGHFTVSVVGPDRPGIVAGISRVLYELGFNIEDSSSTILSGMFAMILVVGHGTMSDEGELSAAFEEARRDLGLTVGVHALVDAEMVRESPFKGTPHIISVYGADRPGIVYRVSRALAERRVNVVDLKTQVAGQKDRPVYVMVLEADIPEGYDVAALEAELSSLAKELSVSVSVRPVETLEL
jgi:glycine cleavage system transcriptional repressor